MQSSLIRALQQTMLLLRFLQVRTHAAAIQKFKPDVIVGKSQGGPTMLKLIQNKVCVATFMHGFRNQQ